MAFHFIAISSDYVLGRRVGWHYASEGKLDKSYIRSFMEKVEQDCGDIQFGIHKLSTESMDWESVLEKDSFFQDVIKTDNVEYFIKQITGGKELKAYDVAKFILTFTPISHLKLQKLLYYAYAEYFLATGKKLFKEPLVAFKYGPVVEDVFYKFRSNGSSSIDYIEDEVFVITAAKITATPSFLRIISSEDGLNAAKSILKVIKQYMVYDARELVRKTHEAGGPWDTVYIEGKNCVITDDLISQYHHVVV